MNTLNNIRYLHLIVGLAALLCGLYARMPFVTQNGPIDLSAITGTLLGLVNIQQFSAYPGKRYGLRMGLSVVASVLLLIGALVPLAAIVVAPMAGLWLTWAVGISVAGV